MEFFSFWRDYVIMSTDSKSLEYHVRIKLQYKFFSVHLIYF